MKPILFNTDMVRAILEGRKTVTRRAVKDRDIINAWDCEQDGTPIAYIDPPTGDSYPPTAPCPYQPGQILYVRETWAKPYGGMYRYKADYNEHDIVPADRGDVSVSANLIKWHPSIHMLREAARIFLRVTGVRVERLQDITEEQARLEGVEPLMMTADVDKPDGEKRWQEVLPALPRFPEVWDRTIKPAARALCGWNANPYVWCVSFDKISKEEALKHDQQ